MHEKLYGVTDLARLTGLSKATISKRHRDHGVGRKIASVIVFTCAEVSEMQDWPLKPGRPIKPAAA